MEAPAPFSFAPLEPLHPERRVILIFVDGLGLGDKTAASNPLRDHHLRLLANHLPKGWAPPHEEGGRLKTLPPVVRSKESYPDETIMACDASLGLTGLPQSATGQTAMMTGVNPALVLGHHVTGFPSPTLKRLLMEHSVFLKLKKKGIPCVFMNAFTPRFFQEPKKIWKMGRLGSLSWAYRASGLPFLSFEDLRNERAVLFDLAQDSAFARSHELPRITPEKTGQNLVQGSRPYKLAVFEYFETDKAGHRRDLAYAVHVLRKLERFLEAVRIQAAKEPSCTVIITSDHGNIEDLSTKSHTHNPIPCIILGDQSEYFRSRLGRLEYMTPALLGYLASPAEKP
ncbi:MAG: hypothetical protein HKN21_08480 [Candidatus Eisenbacteria bacterium]|uniref:Metalloenzyme domain-containing protein n=1 Tax=Eiseniibacteriota bacterium TaxID=2212470 RepID=A0A7Y2E7U0_UNCEI|nr:hypothetical protein [Candidatus Eisenbacteria bacterium]